MMQSAMAIRRRPYPSDLSDFEWKILEPLLPPEKTGGRHRGYALREIINGIEYLIRVGGAWRSLPHDLPQWQSVKTTEKGGSMVMTGRRRSAGENGTSWLIRRGY